MRFACSSTLLFTEDTVLVGVKARQENAAGNGTASSVTSRSCGAFLVAEDAVSVRVESLECAGFSRRPQLASLPRAERTSLVRVETWTDTVAATDAGVTTSATSFSALWNGLPLLVVEDVVVVPVKALEHLLLQLGATLD